MFQIALDAVCCYNSNSFLHVHVGSFLLSVLSTVSTSLVVTLLEESRLLDLIASYSRVHELHEK